MSVFVISIHRNEGVPMVPAPFFADGKPSWSAVLPLEKLPELQKVWEKPPEKFKKDVKSIYVDGRRVFPGPSYPDFGPDFEHDDSELTPGFPNQYSGSSE